MEMRVQMRLLKENYIFWLSHSFVTLNFTSLYNFFSEVYSKKHTKCLGDFEEILKNK